MILQIVMVLGTVAVMVGMLWLLGAVIKVCVQFALEEYGILAFMGWFFTVYFTLPWIGLAVITVGILITGIEMALS